MAAQAVRALPRKRLSRALGRIASARAPRPVVNAAVAAFVKAYDVDLSDVETPSGGFRTFDEFFTRRLRTGARMVDPNPRAVVSPADGRLEDLGEISATGRLLIKGQSYTAGELLGDLEIAAAYEGGRYFVVYLSPRDYHRVHASVAGAVETVRYVPGTLYPVNQIGAHVPKLFVRNERLVILQQSAIHGRVATIMVGAIGVGRIGLSFDDLETNRGEPADVRRYPDGEVVLARGDELGVFHMGSTVVVITPPECDLEMAVPAGMQIRMGEAMARGEQPA